MLSRRKIGGEKPLELPAHGVPGLHPCRRRAGDRAAFGLKSDAENPAVAPIPPPPAPRAPFPGGRRSCPRGCGPPGKAPRGSAPCGWKEDGKWPVWNVGASTATCRFIPKSTQFRKNWSDHWSCWSAPGVPNAMYGPPSFSAREGERVVRGRFPGRRQLGWPGSRENICRRVPRGKPNPSMTGELRNQPPEGVADSRFPHESMASRCVVSPLWMSEPPCRSRGPYAGAFPGRISMEALSGSMSLRRAAAYSLDRR